MSDTRLRELERRWQETGAPEDWAAYVRESLRTGHGVVDEALALLARARAFAEQIADLPQRGAALAEVAWAHAELAHGEEALAIVDHALAVVGNRVDPESLRARMRVGAIRERVQGSGEGRDQLESVLNALPQHEDDALLCDLLAQWWSAAADAGSEEALAAKGWELLVQRTTEEQATILGLSGGGAAAIRLGLEPRLRALLTRELARDDLGSEELDGWLAFNQILDPPPTPPLQALRLLRRHEGWSLKARLRQVVRACGATAWDELQAWIEDLRGHPDELEQHAARMLELAALRGLAEAGDPRVAERLPAALTQAWAAENEALRLKVVSHLVPLLPLLSLPGGRSLGLLREANLQAEREGLQIRLEILEAVAEAAAASGAFDLVEEIVDAAFEIQRTATASERTWRVWAVWRACLRIVTLQEKSRSGALIARVASAARAALGDPVARAETYGVPMYFDVLIECGAAALVLHERQRATELFGAALAAVSQLDAFDQRSALLMTALETQKMEDPIRYGLARSLLDTAEVAGVLQRSEDALSLVTALSADLVRPPT